MLFVLFFLVGLAIAILEEAVRHPSVARALGPYVSARALVLDHWFLASVVALAALTGIALVFLGLKKVSAALNRWRDRIAGLTFKKEAYHLPPRPFSLGELPARPMGAIRPGPEDAVKG